MKSVILSVLLAAFAGFPPPATNTDWKVMKLKGKVKSVTIQQTYRYKKNGVAFTPWEKQYTNIYQFNTTGMFSEYRQLLANGNLNYRIAYSYNTKEKKGEQAYFNKEDNPTIKKALQYDDKGKVIELVEYKKDGTRASSYKYAYDAQGNQTELVYYGEDGTMGSKTTWVYDTRGNIIGVTVETPGYANSYKKYQYDSKGNQAEEAWLDGNKQVSFRFVRSYDDNGNMVEEQKFKNGNNQLDRTTWKYEYDKQGNWTKKTQYTNEGEDFNIEERVIIYY